MKERTQAELDELAFMAEERARSERAYASHSFFLWHLGLLVGVAAGEFMPQWFAYGFGAISLCCAAWYGWKAWTAP